MRGRRGIGALIRRRQERRKLKEVLKQKKPSRGVQENNTKQEVRRVRRKIKQGKNCALGTLLN